MIATILGAFRVRDIRGKILFTAAILALYRLGTHIPAPGVNASAVDAILRSEWAHHMLARSVSDAVGVFDWRKLTWLRAGVRVATAHSGAGVAMRAMLIFVISLHALHELFIVGRSRN